MRSIEEFNVLEILRGNRFRKALLVKEKKSNRLYVAYVIQTDGGHPSIVHMCEILLKTKKISNVLPQVMEKLKPCSSGKIYYLVEEATTVVGLRSVLDKVSYLPFELVQSVMGEVLVAIEQFLLLVRKEDLKSGCFLIPDAITIDQETKHVRFSLYELGECIFPSPTSAHEYIEYMSPESLEAKVHNVHSSIVWSLGCILHELLYGCPPFHGTGNHSLCKNIIEDPLSWPCCEESPWTPHTHKTYPDSFQKRVVIFLMINKRMKQRQLPRDIAYMVIQALAMCEGTHAKAKLLAAGMLEKEVEKRFNFDDLKTHSFFEGVDWDAIKNQLNAPIVLNGIYDVARDLRKDEEYLGFNFDPDDPPEPAPTGNIFEGFTYVN
jgi:serine/threonine protein kinase